MIIFLCHIICIIIDAIFWLLLKPVPAVPRLLSRTRVKQRGLNREVGRETNVLLRIVKPLLLAVRMLFKQVSLLCGGTSRMGGGSWRICGSNKYELLDTGSVCIRAPVFAAALLNSGLFVTVSVGCLMQLCFCDGWLQCFSNQEWGLGLLPSGMHAFGRGTGKFQ